MVKIRIRVKCKEVFELWVELIWGAEFMLPTEFILILAKILNFFFFFFGAKSEWNWSENVLSGQAEGSFYLVILIFI